VWFSKGVEGLDLWIRIRRGTPDVPADGRYHAVHNGNVVGSYRREVDAGKQYDRLLASLRREHPELLPELPSRPDAVHREAIEAQLDRASLFCADSWRHRRRGGKGR
jgi:hypothetical protein